MPFHYNTFGWFDGIASGPRTTTLAPANMSQTEVPGELRANFTGYVWKDLPYKTPVLDDPLPGQRKAMRQAIRAEKVRRALDGVLIAPSNRWIASDGLARARWAAMDALGAALPVDQEEETLENGDFVVTPAFANKVIAAYLALDRALQANAKALITAVNASSDPASIDITAGWPVTFTN